MEQELLINYIPIFSGRITLFCHYRNGQYTTGNNEDTANGRKKSLRLLKEYYSGLHLLLKRDKYYLKYISQNSLMLKIKRKE